jgi:hypothetical protein
MERYFLVRPPPPYNDIILAPKSFNSEAVAIKEVIEFELQGKNYIRYNALTKKPKHTKQRSHIYGSRVRISAEGSLHHKWYH